MKMYAILIEYDYECSDIHDKCFRTLEAAEKEAKEILKVRFGQEDNTRQNSVDVYEMEVSK